MRTAKFTAHHSRATLGHETRYLSTLFITVTAKLTHALLLNSSSFATTPKTVDENVIDRACIGSCPLAQKKPVTTSAPMPVDRKSYRCGGQGNKAKVRVCGHVLSTCVLSLCRNVSCATPLHDRQVQHSEVAMTTLPEQQPSPEPGVEPGNCHTCFRNPVDVHMHFS
eukprot:350290-Chlamydomonas_euryale.AAC.3